MSLQAMTLVLDFAPDHWSSGRRMVALSIADRIGSETNEAWCSIGDIARRTGLHDRMVQRHIAALIDEGILMRSLRDRDNGSQRSNVWTWLWTIPLPHVPQYTKKRTPVHRGLGG